MKKHRAAAFLGLGLVLGLIGSIAAAAQTVQNEQALWSAVMAGENRCDPVVYGELLYTLSSDHALNCLDTSGSFVWRRTIERTARSFLSVTDSGVLLVADATGKIQAVSGQGIYLWSLKLNEPILFAPYNAADGRIYVLTQTSLYCISIKGKIRQHVPLPAAPAQQLCEAGSGIFALPLISREFLLVSASGELLSTRAAKKGLNILAAAPGGYIIGSDGVLSYYHTALSMSSAEHTGSLLQEQPVWNLQESMPLFVKVFGTELLCAYTNGTVQLRSLADGSLLQHLTFGCTLTLPLSCMKADGDYYLACKGFAGAISSNGMIKREKKLAATPFQPVITPSGILITADDWVINGWKFDTKILKNAPHQERSVVSTPYQTQVTPPPAASLSGIPNAHTIPFFVPYGDTEALLARIESSILQGTAYQQEAADAAILEIILLNTKRSAVLPYDFTVYEQAQAAELLGKFESLVYRPLLLEAARRTTEPVIATGIIRALGAITADPDGKSIQTIQDLLKRCGVQRLTPVYAACEALAEIAKYGDKTAADAAVKALFAIAAGAYPENLRQYARQKIQTIVE